MKTLRILVILTTLVMVMVLLGCKAAPVTPAEFYKGKTVEFGIQWGAGSGVDVSGRVTAEFLEKYTGMHTNIVNRVGGGGMLAAVYLQRTKPDGFTMGWMHPPSTFLNYLMGEPGAKYEPDLFIYIMAMLDRASVMWVAADGPYNSIDDLRAKKGLKFASCSKSGNQTLASVSTISICGLDAKVITGFKTVADCALSIQQGETDGTAINVLSAQRYYVQGQLKPLFILGSERVDLWPEVPTIGELVPLTEEQKYEVSVWGKYLNLASALMLPPGVAEDKVQYLVDIADKIIVDPEFLAAQANVMGIPFTSDDFATGDYLQEVATEIVNDRVKVQEMFGPSVEKYRM